MRSEEGGVRLQTGARGRGGTGERDVILFRGVRREEGGVRLQSGARGNGHCLQFTVYCLQMIT